MAKTIVMGGGPAGSIAAIALRKLGQEVEVFEKARFPRYRVGESLLPGTLSVLQRLGLGDKLESAGFVKKPSATFLWGADQAPWTFSFATARSAPWICDHAIQVYRQDFDQLLLNEARQLGATVHEGIGVRSVDLDTEQGIAALVESPGGEQRVEADYLIDASGAGSPLVRQLKNRRYDAFYRSLAIWSYYRRADPFQGALKGTTYSITFQDGWVWMIPLKGDIYSVGVIVDQSKGKELAALGAVEFYTQTLARCRRAMDILDGAERFDEVRVVQDWSYESDFFSRQRFFLCGDSACFTDPLFSQGVHLAAQSAVCAAAAISRMDAAPSESDALHVWYNRSYRETYEQYHEFLASFYTFASFTEPDSEFWRRRRIAESEDERLERKQWFERLSERAKENDFSVADFRDRASTMIAIGRHPRLELSDAFSETELNPARLRWISDLTRQLNAIKTLKWVGEEVRLEPYYKVNPTTFQLELRSVLTNERGRRMTKYPLSAAEQAVFADLKRVGSSYRDVVEKLAALGHRERSSQIVIRTLEAGLLNAFDKNGKQVTIQDRLRFDGVGEEYEV